MAKSIVDIKERSSHFDQVVDSIRIMDIIELDKLLSEERTYMTLPKSVFIEQLGCVLNYFKKGNASSLRVKTSICAGCEAGARVCLFICIEEKKYLAFVIETNSFQEVTDMYSCNRFTVNNFSEYRSYTQICFDNDSQRYFDNHLKMEMPVSR